jgi:hypothetical protein
MTGIGCPTHQRRTPDVTTLHITRSIGQVEPAAEILTVNRLIRKPVHDREWIWGGVPHRQEIPWLPRRHAVLGAPMLVGAFCAAVGARGGGCRPDLGGSGASEHRWKGAWAPIAGDRNPRPCMLGLGLRVNLMEEGVAGHCFIARECGLGKICCGQQGRSWRRKRSSIRAGVFRGIRKVVLGWETIWQPGPTDQR